MPYSNNVHLNLYNLQIENTYNQLYSLCLALLFNVIIIGNKIRSIYPFLFPLVVASQRDRQTDSNQRHHRRCPRSGRWCANASRAWGRCRHDGQPSASNLAFSLSLIFPSLVCIHPGRAISGLISPVLTVLRYYSFRYHSLSYHSYQC